MAAPHRRIYLLMAGLWIALLFGASSPAAAAHARSRAVSSSAAAPAAPLAQIHVLGDRPAPFALDAHAAMMVDARTGAVLYSFNEHARMQPASLAKIMTFFLTLDALKARKLDLNTEVTISEAAWRLSMDQSVSRMFLGVGRRVAVRDLLYGLMVSSGNDAAVALAEDLGGSGDAFAAQMNEKAHAIGLAETRFTNPDGLPAEGEYTTASDMVKLARALLTAHPEATGYTGAKEFTFDRITQNNFNTLLFHDSRVNGIKTGHVAEAGFHLVASAQANGMTLIAAVMGAPSAEKRWSETEKLIDWAFRTFVTEKPELAKALPSTIRVYEGEADDVAIGPASEVYVTLGRGEEKRVSVGYTANARFLIAPLEKGQRVGELTMLLDGKPETAIPVVTRSAVPRGGIFKRLSDRIRLKL